MSTRSYILMETEETENKHEYYGVYCHWDGYPSYNGNILLNHYKNRDKVEKLISLGDLSSLGPNIDPDPSQPHSFDDDQPGVCVFYGRDRGEKDVGPRMYNIFSLMIDSWAEYLYIYTLDGKWKVIDIYQDMKLQILEEPDQAYRRAMIRKAIEPVELTQEMCEAE